VDQVILKCLEKDPSIRIGTADELDASLAELQHVDPWAPEEARAWWALNRPKPEA
jgi:hypothetical protein